MGERSSPFAVQAGGWSYAFGVLYPLIYFVTVPRSKQTSFLRFHCVRCLLLFLFWVPLMFVRIGEVKWEVKIKATLRELRNENESGGFKDNHTFKSVDGKLAKPNFGRPYLVYNVNSLGIGDSPHPDCLDYHFANMDDGRTLQFNIDSKLGARDPS